MTHKLAIVVRTDLDMGVGKIAAQAAHAAVSAVVRDLRSPDLQAWWEAGQPKVVLRTPDEPGLLAVHDRATELGVPVVIIHDAGRTEVAPNTATCCAVGPATEAEVNRVCGQLALLR